MSFGQQSTIETATVSITDVGLPQPGTLAASSQQDLYFMPVAAPELQTDNVRKRDNFRGESVPERQNCSRRRGPRLRSCKVDGHDLLTNSIEPVKPVTPGNYAADPDLPLTITHWRYGDDEFTIGGNDTACLELSLSEGQIVERSSGGVWSCRPYKPGLVTVTDPDEITKFVVRGQVNVARLYIPVENLGYAAALNRRPKVKARFVEREPDLERCAQRAFVALHDGSGTDPLLLSSIVLELSKTIIEQPFPPCKRAIGGLARGQMRRVEELIDSRLSAPVASSPSLNDLAAEANLSVHHFAREFRRTTGVPPYAFMLRRRLERARQLVIQSNLPLARVGMLSGFPSAAHFADRFRREMGVSPGALRRAAQK